MAVARIELFGEWNDDPAPSPHWVERPDGQETRYSDRAISGASLIRPGIQELIDDAGRRRFDVILTESLDRLSRDQEDVAGLYKRMTFLGVRILALSAGEISELHIGLKGTMGALYLKDLADKTRRGLRGRVEAGKSGGGLCLRLYRAASGRRGQRSDHLRADDQFG